MVGDAKSLRWSLKNFGLSDSVISAAWPDWWTDAAEGSLSSQAELRFSVARKLGLDPSELLDDAPRFVWRDEAKFKRFTGDNDFERAALSSFGISIARQILIAAPTGSRPKTLSASFLRKSLLSQAPFVRLVDLLGLCWAIGIPVVHLRLFPLSAKRMCAMTVRSGNRFAILLGKDASYPSPSAFHLAHEIGHIALGHLDHTTALVDVEDPLEGPTNVDEEESSADRYALELLTGSPQPMFATEAQRYTARELARVSSNAAAQLQIEPGTLALCFGYSTREWGKAFGALRWIYSSPHPVWTEINQIAKSQLEWSSLTEDAARFIRAVMQVR